MGGDKTGRGQAVAIDKHDIIARGACQGIVPRRRHTEPVVRVPYVQQFIVELRPQAGQHLRSLRPDPSSATTTSYTGHP